MGVELASFCFSVSVYCRCSVFFGTELFANKKRNLMTWPEKGDSHKRY